MPHLLSTKTTHLHMLTNVFESLIDLLCHHSKKRYTCIFHYCFYNYVAQLLYHLDHVVAQQSTDDV